MRQASACSPGAERQRRSRQRRRRGEAVLKVSVKVDRLVHALIDSDRLTESEAADPAKVAAAASSMIDYWSKWWKKGLRNW